jgi:polyvinyl alcohol dehydrogenase (cytochrome)
LIIWSHKISEYDGVDGAISRVSPAVDGNQVIIGDILSSNQVHNGANVTAVDRQTGFLWIALSGHESYDGSCLSN